MFLPLFIIGFILFWFGLIIGSFLNVVIYRTLNDESFVTGRSRCDHCKKQIAWYDNIPLLSFLILGGKCRHCRKPIALTHPVVELLTGVLFVWWYAGGFFFFRFFQLSQHPFHIIQPVFWLLVGIFLLIIFITDSISYIIPDYAVGSLLGLSIVYRVALVVSGIMKPTDFLFSILGTLLITGFFFALWFFSKGKGMGFGDVKYCLPMGLLLGWPSMLVGTFLAFILGAVVGLCLVVLKRKNMKATIPFGPFLVVGTALALVYGNRIVEWYLGML
ncbi:MAG: prepilin peptidase [Patescibacteria group bacterium]